MDQMQRATSAAAVMLLLAGALVLFSPPAGATYPGVDGRLSFSRIKDHCGDILSVDPDGSNLNRYTKCSVIAESSAWAPDGKRLAAGLLNGDDQDVFLYLIDASTGAKAKVPGIGKAAGDPYWSPDGHDLIFVSDATDFGAFQNIYRVPASGGPPIDLTGFPLNNSHLVADPEFSPDGTKIVFQQSTGNGPSQLWVMDADGSNATQLTSGLSGNSRSPSWSPDGTKIAFANDSAGSFDIYVMNSDGRTPAALPNASTDPETEPVWAPDGKAIAYTKGCADGGCRAPGVLQDGDVYVMNADGSVRTPVVTADSEHAPEWATSSVDCSACGAGGGGGHARKVTLSISGVTLRGRVSVLDGVAKCRSRVPVSVQRLQSLQGDPSPADWRRGTVKKTTTTRAGAFRIHIKLGGEYRAIAGATRLTTGDTCRRTTSKVRENDLIHDPRGDSTGPIDIQWASMRYAHHKVIAKIISYTPFSGTNNPCFLVGSEGFGSAGGSVACFRQVICCTDNNGGGPPVRVARPDPRTIVFTTTVDEWKQMGFSRQAHWLYWLVWARESDSVLWDDAPTGCFAKRPECSKGPVLTLPKSAF